MGRQRQEVGAIKARWSDYP